MSTVPSVGMVFLACVFAAAAMAQERETVVATPVAEALLRQAAAAQAGDAASWADCEQRVQSVYAEWHRVHEGWMKRAPPPRPDLAALALPVQFLAARWLELTKVQRSPSAHYDFVAALARSADPRAQDLLLEQYDQPGREMYRGDLARVLSPALPGQRAHICIAAQLQRQPAVVAHELLFLLLQRCRGELSPRARAAGRDWLATFHGGPANGAAEQIWRLRFDLGDASDRDAVIPHLLGKQDLLYSLWVILHAPLTHANLAAALRERRGRMTEHELGYLTVLMSCALVASDPDGEVATFVVRIEELRARVVAKTASGDEADELQRRLAQLVDVPGATAFGALERHIRDADSDWHVRCVLLEQLIRRRGQDAEALRHWWEQHAPVELQRLLQDRLQHE